ncbi:uncharacterized protein TNCV_3216721 [Trichonephila clavipes]|nr:uncharacterized protein TNCV_3216721 [Trichonephila clavipes]
MLTAVPWGLGSNLEEDMDVCKCIVPLRHESTLNSCRATNLLVWLVEGVERWDAPDHPQVSSLKNWGGNELNRTVICMVLRATANERRHLALCHNEYRRPRSGLCRSGDISNNNNGGSSMAPRFESLIL